MGQRPSLLVGLHPTRDAWLALQFDQAVTLLGRYIDGRLAEHDKDGNPKTTLVALLAAAPPSDPALLAAAPPSDPALLAAAPPSDPARIGARLAGRFQSPTTLLKGGVYEL